MSDLTKHVVSLEVAKQLDKALKGAGVEVENAFMWNRYRRSKYNKWSEWKVQDIWHYRMLTKYRTNHKADLLDQYIPTYLLTELLEVLPNNIEYRDYEYNWQIERGDSCIFYVWDAPGYNPLDGSEFYFGNEQSLEDAAAKLLMWCIENGYVNGTP